MSRVLVFLLLALIFFGLVLGLYFRFSGETIPTKALVAIPQASAPCPWRDAETDMTNWFPGATRFYIYDQILSGKRLALQERLGRPLTPDENALHVYLVVSNRTDLGTVLTRRLKAPSGAMEIALGLDNNDLISHFKIQRMREPDPVVASLEALKLDEQLRTKSAKDDFTQIKTRAQLPSVAACASNIVDAVHSLLVLREAARTDNLPSHH